MEGKRDEVLAKPAKAHKEKNKKKVEKDGAPTNNSGPTASGIQHDKSGHAYIVDSISGQEILLTSDDASTSPTIALATLDSADDLIYISMSDADHFEYDTLFIKDHSALVDWHERRRTVSAGNCLVASINTNTCTTLSADARPFILDSGATIHILPVSSDFFELKAVPLRTIKGIRGSSISATGIGKICL